ncbi:MAG TPA: OmpA family protein [Prolixibacteraceae bacterium]|nr:OmpA family protein [Prolixibacteraceae bacterium]
MKKLLLFSFVYISVQAVFAQENVETNPPGVNWNRFDFLPGSEIIFEDNQENEQNGEFPGKWDLVTGTVENAQFQGENVIYIRETGNFPNGIVPLIKEAPGDYLPDEFTLELNCYFEKDVFNSNYRIYLFDSKKQKKLPYLYIDIYVNKISFSSKGTEKQYPDTERSNVDKVSKWRHISVSFNKRALKVYMDDVRLINIPSIEENPTGISLSSNHASENKNLFVKNVRLAKGAVPLYDKILTEGKYVTNGIRFDVNKATIKPESMGTLNYVYKMMNDNPTLNFSVEGHTDSDGDESLNQKLSEARAKAVMDKLIEMGISSGRLKSKGWGESQPVAGNATTEEKAQNRRVEFVAF